jgi:preprotein translocase subunit SecG
VVGVIQPLLAVLFFVVLVVILLVLVHPVIQIDATNRKHESPHKISQHDLLLKNC